jgi:RNA polymerase sigma-70 factor, ECF subfamily
MPQPPLNHSRRYEQRLSDKLRPDAHEKTVRLACREKNRPAFAMLYEQYKKPLGKYLMARVNDQEVAYELYQNTFMQAWQFISPEKESYFDKWLYTIAHNLVVDHIRHKAVIEFLRLPENEPDEPKDYLLFTRLSIGGHEELICDRLCLEQALAAMSPKYRACVQLQVIGGLSQHEISEKLGIDVKTVRSNVYRGFIQLRNIYMEMMSDQGRTMKGEC